MSTFILVLEGDMHRQEWLARKQSNNSESLLRDLTFDPAVNDIFPKDADTDQIFPEIVQAINIQTQDSIDAHIIELTRPGVNSEESVVQGKNTLFNFCILLMFFVLCSCQETGRLTRRYTEVQSPTATDNQIINYIKVNGFVFDLDSAKPTPSIKNVFALSDHGQQSYIQALGSKESKSEDLQAKMIRPLTVDDASSSTVEQNIRFTKRLLFAVSNQTPYEADRISRLTIRIPLTSDPNIKIISFSKIATEYQTVDLGKIDLTNALTLGLTGNVGLTSKKTNSTANTTDAASNNGIGSTSTVGGEIDPSLGANANISHTRTLAEEILLHKRYVSLSGYVTKDSLVLYEESVTGVDLTGNIIADVTFEYKSNVNPHVVYSFTNIFKNKQVVHPDSIEVSQKVIYDPNLAGDLSLPYTCDATVRHVRDHQRTIPEGDDVVTFVQQSVPVGNNILLLPTSQFQTKFWIIKDVVTDKVLEINNTLFNQHGVVFFDSYDMAVSFLKWLKRIQPRIGTGSISYGDYVLLGSAGSPAINAFITNAQVRTF